MASSGTSPLDLYGEQVEEMVQRGEAFSEIEGAIDSARLPDDERAALWLLAWSLRRRARRPPPVPHKPRRPRPVLVPLRGGA